MLDDILDFKNGIMNRSNSIIDWNTFYAALLQEQISTSFSLNSDEPHWNNYFHATLVSAYMQLTNFDLVNWQKYILESATFSSLLGCRNPNEGEVLELFVVHSINKVFAFGTNNLNIHAYRANHSSNPTYLSDDGHTQNVLSAEDNSRIIENLKVVMKLRGQPQKAIWGDNDIIVTLTHNSIVQQFCIISCKTSLRERVYQSIFWSMHSRMEGVGKHVFVTTDKGASGNSEIGNRGANNNAKKSRDVLESTMDRVYVLRNSSEVNRSQVIKDFSFLQQDLINWAKDIAGSY
ncbi:BsaWI family type II restriction enzyme [Maribacter sp. Asnod1-A12]|uniref:BsaWI family type II restriction enzyme n=1 Tax=Maribacter sp. Asnod1-A12 TaxID=3160576 RepID=UPI0038667115